MLYAVHCVALSLAARCARHGGMGGGGTGTKQSASTRLCMVLRMRTPSSLSTRCFLHDADLLTAVKHRVQLSENKQTCSWYGTALRKCAVLRSKARNDCGAVVHSCEYSPAAEYSLSGRLSCTSRSSSVRSRPLGSSTEAEWSASPTIFTLSPYSRYRIFTCDACDGWQ